MDGVAGEGCFEAPRQSMSTTGTHCTHQALNLTVL